MYTQEGAERLPRRAPSCFCDALASSKSAPAESSHVKREINNANMNGLYVPWSPYASLLTSFGPISAHRYWPQRATHKMLLKSFKLFQHLSTIWPLLGSPEVQEEVAALEEVVAKRTHPCGYARPLMCWGAACESKIIQKDQSTCQARSSKPQVPFFGNLKHLRELEGPAWRGLFQNDLDILANPGKTYDGNWLIYI